MAYSDIETYKDMFRNTKSYRASLKQEDIVAFRIRQVCSISFFSCVAYFIFTPLSVLLISANNILQSTFLDKYYGFVFQLLIGSFFFICFVFAVHLVSILALVIKRSSFISGASLVICLFIDILIAYVIACIIYFIR